MNDDNYTNVILEEMNGKFDAVMEYVQDIPEIKDRLTNVESTVEYISDKADVIESVVKAHSHDIAEIKTDMNLVKSILNDHEDRITALEPAT